MKAQDIMTKSVRTIAPDQTLQEAAQCMAECDAGSLPVAENDRLVGMITDRDIALRAVARGVGPDGMVRDAMSSDIKYCFADDDIDDIQQNMADIQVRRLPVVDSDKRLVGILSLGDLAARGHADAAGEAYEGIARSSDQHNQSNEQRT